MLSTNVITSPHDARAWPMEYDFGIHPDLTVRTVIVGREQHPVVVIDNLLREPRSLVEFAANEVDFRRLKSFDATFNRVLIYRSRRLHSGSVTPACGYSDDPRRGRLTANAFFYIRAAA